MSSNFDQAKFSDAVGSTFVLVPTQGEKVDLELTEVSDLKERQSYQSFAALFLGPEDLVIDQGLYEIEHESLGPMALFLVPVGLDGRRMQLEAVFNLKVDQPSP